MLGHKVREFKPLSGICLEDLVPADNFYRQVERSIDLSFIYDLADEFYSSMGRPSVDPVVATGQNLKRLIKHDLRMLLSFLNFPSTCLIPSLIPTFSTAWHNL